MIMKPNTCLNCKYEPEWGEWSEWGEWRGYSTCFGRCKWLNYLPTPKLPKVYIIRVENIERFSDDSGVKIDCPAWEAKQ